MRDPSAAAMNLIENLIYSIELIGFIVRNYHVGEVAGHHFIQIDDSEREVFCSIPH